MLRVFDTSSTGGRQALEELIGLRRLPDFGSLLEVLPIVKDVLGGSLETLTRYVRELDGVDLGPEDLLVTPRDCPGDVGPAPSFVQAFRLAARRVTAYHRRQRPVGFGYRDRDGVSFRETPVPHEAVGVYVPGGRAFYPSSLLMGVVPARVAGARRIVLATPPRAYRESIELRWAARELGVDQVLLAGGAQGIAGLVGLCRCTKIVGPGNRFVAAAKHLVSGLVSVDLPAGPSEVLILASAKADPSLVAADLLAQAEHDPEAVCLLFTTSAILARRVAKELRQQIADLPTRETARTSLSARGRVFLFPSLGKAAAAAVEIAAEHVQLMGPGTARYRRFLMGSAGAVFVGQETPTALGDYLAGPNHVLPTGGAARSFSGLSVRDFMRWGRSVTFPASASRKLAKAAVTLARFEGLEAHARSLERRAR